MNRQKVIHQIRSICEAEYAKVTDWVHDIYHIKVVVRNGKKLSSLEKLKPKDSFLVELSCWLHDLGRVDEATGLEFLQSNHADVSYQKSKAILAPYAKFIGRESVYRVLEAVREHNLPTLKHPHNRIAQFLIDADRGAGLNVIGIFSMLNYLHLAKTEPVRTKQQARKWLPLLTRQLVAKQVIPQAIQKLSYFRGWYYGDPKQTGTAAKVAALHTKAACHLYLKGLLEIEQYIHYLQTLPSVQGYAQTTD